MKADTVIILALALSVLLVFVYVGKSITGWGGQTIEKIKGGMSDFKSDWLKGAQKIEKPISDFKTDWLKGAQKIKGFFGWKPSFAVDDLLLEAMYDLDNFVFTSNDTDKEYLTQLVISTEKTRVYDVSFYDVSLLQDIVRDYEKIMIPNRLMKIINSLSEGMQVNIYSNSYDAELTFAKSTPETDVLYRLRITKK